MLDTLTRLMPIWGSGQEGADLGLVEVGEFAGLAHTAGPVAAAASRDELAGRRAAERSTRGVSQGKAGLAAQVGQIALLAALEAHGRRRRSDGRPR
jgi:hypothetical protein